MSFLKFEKSELINLEYALAREVIRSNRAGSYASTTIIGCNTRKYHGLLVCPLEEMGGEHHVLLSTLDATIVQHDKDFNLGIHKYEGDKYVPKGHKYVRDFDATKASFLIYRVGGVVLSREILMVSKAEQVLVRYTLMEAHSETLLRLTPFLAFRNHHSLSKSNLYANTRYREIPNGIGSWLYEGYPELHMQCSKPVEFVPVPDWYYNIEYMEEQKRGYEYKEDLYVPGYFEVPIKRGESIIFSASTREIVPAGLKRKFTAELDNRIPRDSFTNCLLNAAEQFIVRKKRGTEIISGFPWFGLRGRDTFLALPGLTMTTGDFSTSLEVIDTMLTRLNGGLFEEVPGWKMRGYPAADTPLWFIWALQQYAIYDPWFDIWKKYGKAIKSVLEAFRDGSAGIVHMKENGLIYAAQEGRPLTWMDAIVHGRPATPREGFIVEINALWHNAVCQALEWAANIDKKFVERWAPLPEMISGSFNELFWDQQRGYLADFFNENVRDMSVRPNQVLAVSMDYSPLTIEMKKSILDVIERELLTPRGLRSLSPKSEAYQGVYEGDQVKRDSAYHQGTVYPWLLEHFIKGYLVVNKRSGYPLVKRLYADFEEALNNGGIGSISEVYDGNPPHDPKGGISQATAVAALLRIGEMTEKFNQ
jgi:predicted glycogen debranching enzyme